MHACCCYPWLQVHLQAMLDERLMSARCEGIPSMCACSTRNPRRLQRQKQERQRRLRQLPKGCPSQAAPGSSGGRSS